ncbi:hypothetical protein NC653_007924 [Populus alba x Populus x berolinensis]|uniref:Uncharacterized protein n=1 Tax=Populus alba x Populus x berolinensis TaxID=444605 RepID=A0AAD6R5H6_9ROSI|nr:hypothetical protein NC653_007924 [Populus alba x Populus x berolinensis]
MKLSWDLCSTVHQKAIVQCLEGDWYAHYFLPRSLLNVIHCKVSVPFDVCTNPYRALLFKTSKALINIDAYISFCKIELRGEDKMKHVTAIMGRWLDKLAVDQLIFHVAMFNFQNLLLLSPGDKAGRCLLALPCETEFRTGRGST